MLSSQHSTTSSLHTTHQSSSGINKSTSSKVDDDTISEEDVVLNSVQISPGNIIFDNAYDGKHFHRKLTFQNTGVGPVFIRLCDPTSSAIQLKSFVKGYTLSSGLKIVRSVRFTYKKAMPISGAHCYIYVNGTEYELHFVVNLTEAIISLNSCSLDFGRIDASCGDTMRKLIIRNSGYQAAQFVIDLGRNDLNVIAEPMRGQVAACSSVTVQVEIVGWKEGEFEREFWIKTTPPQRVLIHGTVVAPRLVVQKSISRLSFVLLDFKTIYYGSHSTKIFIIKNSSPSAAMFYIMAEVKGVAMPLKQAREIDESYKNFHVEPEDGRWGAEKGTTIRVTFAPIKSHENHRNYQICFLRIFRIDCHDLTIDLMNYSHRQHRQMIAGGVCEQSQFGSLSNHSLSQITFSQIYIGDDEEEADSLRKHVLSDQTVMVCLHGEIEDPDIEARPNFIQIDNMVLNEQYRRELFLKNSSERIPIKLKYKKMVYIDVEPKEFVLNPTKAIEVLVKIRVTKLDNKISTWIPFELLAVDHPVCEKKWRQIGITKIKIELSSNQIAAKSRIKSICAPIAHNEFWNWDHAFEKDQLNPRDMLRKATNRKYYNMYLQRKHCKSSVNLPMSQDYETSDKKMLLMEYLNCHGCKIAKNDEFLSIDRYLTPLSPKELYNIKIYPKTINLKRMAPFTSTTSSFNIENNNPFAITILLIASKSYVTFNETNRGVIGPNQTKSFAFVFTSTLVGKFPARIDVIINTSAVFKITVMVHVMAKYLHIEPNRIEFRDNEPPTKFVTIKNGLNSDTCFDWELSNEFYTIQPMEGGVPAGRTTTCMITLLPFPSVAKLTECVLTAESGQKKILEVVCLKKTQNVVFSTLDLDLGVIPFNTVIKKQIKIKNLKNNMVTFNIPNASPLPGMYISPENGYLVAKDCKILTITIKMQAIVQFVVKIVVLIDEEMEYQLSVKGSVDVPMIKLDPDMIVFRKISPYAFDRAIFQLSNQSKFDLNVKFPMDDLVEFSITSRENSHLPHIKELTLRSQEVKILYLHFYPDFTTTYTIFLPYVVNDLIGPVVHGGSHISTFIGDIEEQFRPFESICKVINVKKTLPYLRINCCAVYKMVHMHNRYMEFRYFGKDHPNNYLENHFTIENILNEALNFCIVTESLSHAFNLVIDCDLPYKQTDYTLLVELKECEKFQLKIVFDPTDMGKYSSRLPIFIENHVDEKIFNYLSLKGEYLLPTIEPSELVLYFEHTLPHIRNQMSIDLVLKNHFPNCRINTDVDLCEISIEYERDDNYDTVMPVTITCCSASPVCYDTKIVFLCSCQAQCDVIVKGVVDSTMFISNWYANILKTSPLIQDANKTSGDPVKSAFFGQSLQSVTGPTFHNTFINLNTTSYPLFPRNSSNSEYAVYMRDLVAFLEDWIFCQVFNCDKYYRIPDGFIYEFRQIVHGKLVQQEVPLVLFLMKIIKPGIKKCFVTRPFEGTLFESHEYMIYLLEIYQRIFHYLRQFPIFFLPSTKPKYLLNYQQYTQFQTLQRKKIFFTESKYYYFSKQCWLDLIIQIIKVFTVNRTELPPDYELSPYWTEDGTNYEFGICSMYEQYHFDWLIQTYEKERRNFPKFVKTIYNIIHMDENLQDSLLFGIVTATYCPYLKSIIDQMFFPPSSYDQYFHNACLLVKSWQMLNLSYQICPGDIINLNYIRSALLVAYLHDVLPNCTPSSCLTITAPLTCTSHASIELENKGEETINYKTIFFQNESNLFSINEAKIRIARKKRKVVKIYFFAKYVSGLTSFLLFSGETPSQKYCKSMCVQLEGVPDLTSGMSSEESVALELYKNCRMSSKLKSPHGCEAMYKLYMFYNNKGVVPNDKMLVPATKLLNYQLINETAAMHDEVDFDANGSRNLEMKVCCLQPNQRDIYVFYLNDTLGDFGIKFTIRGKVANKHSERINIVLPKFYDCYQCVCKGKANVVQNCPMILRIKIPARNETLWTGIKSIILRDVGEQERRFWKKIIYTPLGTRIIILLMHSQHSRILGIKFDEPVDYDVLVEPNGPIVSIKKLTIKDVIAETMVELAIHPVVKLVDGLETFLRLNAQDGREKRLYKLVFKHGENSLVHI